MDELSPLLNTYPLDVVAITESWLTDDIIDELVLIDGYKTFRKDRVHGRGGGVCAFVSADIPCKRRQDLEDPSFECMWCWLRPVRLPRKISGLICAILYNPPDTPLPEQNNLVKYMVDKLDVIRTAHPDCGVVLLGDYNRLEICDLLIHQNLKQIVRTPTRGEHVLDLIVTNLPELYNEPSIIAPLGTSDHNVVKWTSSASGSARSHGKSISKKHVRRFPQSARDAFGRWCNNHTWFADVENPRSCSELASFFSQDISSAIDRIFPTKIVKIHCSDKPWMIPSLKQLINERQRAFHSGDRDLWRHYRSKVKKEISLKKRSFYRNKVQHFKSCNPKKWWDSVKLLSGRKNTSNNAIRIEKDGVPVTGKVLAQLLNGYFSSINTELPCLVLCSLPAYLPARHPLPTISVEDTCSKMLSISTFKSHGPDAIPNRIIKDYAYELAEPVSRIFNISLSSGLVPSMWKDAIIIPVPKSQYATCEDEVRPISLTACLSKILEDFVVKWMMEDIRHKIDPKQFGSLQGMSTTFCLIDMINNWLSTLDVQSRYLRVCFVDFSKAFDRINHNILIKKLLSLGVRESLVPWICSFLSNRRQAVKVDGFLSEWVPVNGGVPQGTKLGPVLFLVMINDLELRSTKMNHWKYVDDITLSESLSINEISTLQLELDAIQSWAVQNDMKLNGKKCKEMLISFLYDQPDIPRLCIDGLPLELVHTFKVLGLTLNDKLKWQENVEIMVKKAAKRLYILRVLSRINVPSVDLLTIYFSLVRSILEYACPVWHTNLPQYLSDKIEHVQKRAFRIIYPGRRYDDALSIAQCPRLTDRRQILCCKTFKKIQEPTSQLHYLLPSSREDMHGRFLRNNLDYTVPRCRTDRDKKSFIPAMCSFIPKQ